MRKLVAVLLVSFATVLVSGCSDTPTLMPTPKLYTMGKIKPFENVPNELKNNHVEVLYLTDRKRDEEAKNEVKYSYARSRSVAFGVCNIEIGKNLTWEQLDAASQTSKRAVDTSLKIVSTKEIIRFPETPRILMELPPFQPEGKNPTDPEAIALKEEIEHDKKIAREALTERLAKTPVKEVYLFVHGYNNSFDDAVLTIGQMWHFLGRQGVPIAYSWPAGHGGLIRGYTYDRESSEFTVYHLKEMIRTIAENPDVQKINIICHSRGTGVVVSALAELHMEISGSGQRTRDVLKLGTLVLAAPDIDLDVLIQRAVTVRLGQVPERTTMYVCARDRALGISNWLFSGVTRAGRVRADMFPPSELKTLRESKSVEIVDAQITDAGSFAHSYFHSNPCVSSDLILLMRYHLFPGPESGRPLKREKSGFWVVDDKYLDVIPPAKETARAD